MNSVRLESVKKTNEDIGGSNATAEDVIVENYQISESKETDKKFQIGGSVVESGIEFLKSDRESTGSSCKINSDEKLNIGNKDISEHVLRKESIKHVDEDNDIQKKSIKAEGNRAEHTRYRTL